MGQATSAAPVPPLPADGRGRADTGTVRLALVGLGSIGMSGHLPAMLRHPRVLLAGLVDPAVDRRDEARRLVGDVAAVPDVQQLPDGIDGYVLATPPWVTPSLAAGLATAGHPVLAEKPIAVSGAAAAPLRTLHRRARQLVQVGMTYRHDPVLQQVRQLLDDGVLGRPLLVRAHIYDEARDPADVEHADRIVATLAHGTPLLHEGAHVFDWLAFLMGPPQGPLDSWSLRTDPGLPADNLAGGRLRYPDGSVALVEFGWFTAALPPCELSLLGPDGELELDAMTFIGNLRTGGGDRRISAPGERDQRSFDRQLDRFVQLVTGSRPHPSPGLQDALDVLDLAERFAAASTGDEGCA